MATVISDLHAVFFCAAGCLLKQLLQYIQIYVQYIIQYHYFITSIGHWCLMNRVQLMSRNCKPPIHAHYNHYKRKKGESSSVPAEVDRVTLAQSGTFRALSLSCDWAVNENLQGCLVCMGQPGWSLILKLSLCWGSKLDFDGWTHRGFDGTLLRVFKEGPEVKSLILTCRHLKIEAKYLSANILIRNQWLCCTTCKTFKANRWSGPVSGDHKSNGSRLPGR